MSLRITYKLLMMLVIAMVTALSGKAQTTVEVGLADLRFCNIAVNGGKITMDLQIRSAITAEQFAIGAHTVFFEFDPASITAPAYTSALFDDKNKCAFGGAAAPYFAPAFTSDNISGLGNLTTNMQIPNQGCPMVTATWLTMGSFSFDIINNTIPMGLNFLLGGGETLFNKNDNTPQHNISSAVGLNTLPVPQCPTNVGTPIALAQNLCNDAVNGNTITLPALVLPPADECGAQPTFTWTQVGGPSVGTIAPGQTPTVTLGQKTSCGAEAYQFALTVGCTQDANVALNGGTATYSVYPTVNAPTVTATGNDPNGNCTYILTPACAGDVLNPNTIANKGPGSPASTTDVSVSNAGCPLINIFTVNIPACAASCPSQGDVTPLAYTENLCTQVGGVSVTLPAPNAIGGAFGANATFKWKLQSGPGAVNVPAGNTPTVTIPNNTTNCNAQTYVFKLDVGCTQDANVLLNGGTATYTLYPTPNAPTVTRLNDNCDYSLTPNCPGDILTPNSVPATAPGSTGNTFDVTVANTGCAAVAFILPLEDCPAAPLPCPTQGNVTQTSGSQNVCSSAGTATLPSVTVGGPNAGFATFAWTQTAGPTATIVSPNAATTDVQFAAVSGCNPVTLTFAVTIGCTNDGAVNLNGGSTTVVVYPDPQAPTVSLSGQDSDGFCTYSVTAACPGDVIGGSVPNAPADTPASTTNLTVSNAACAAVDFTVNVPACPELVNTCPVAADITPAIDPLAADCGGGVDAALPLEATLPLVGIGGPNAAQATVTWVQTSGPAVSVPQGQEPTVMIPDNTTCDPITYTFDCIVSCTDNTGLVIDGGTATYTINPIPQAPTVVKLDNTCTYGIVVNCPNDVTTPATIDNKALGDPETNVSLEVSNGNCTATFDVVVPACDVEIIECPTQDDVTVASDSQSFCLTNITVSLPAASVGGSFGANATYTWVQNSGPSVSVPAGATPSVKLKANSTCSPINYSFVLNIGCTDDATVSLSGGTANYTVWPVPKAPSIILNDLTCSYKLTPACPEDVLTPNSIDDQVPGTPSQTVSIAVGNDGCSALIFNVKRPACPGGNDCPNAGDVTPVSGSTDICSDAAGNTINLPSVDVSGDGSANATVTWIQTAGPTATIAGSVVTIPGNTSCGAVTFSFSATVSCLVDGSVNLAAGSVNYVAYPEPQAPTINLTDLTCNYEIVVACPGDVVSPATFGPLAPGSTNGATILTVTSSIAGNPCATADYTVSYDACPGDVTCAADAGVPTGPADTDICNDSANAADNVSGAATGFAVQPSGIFEGTPDYAYIVTNNDVVVGVSANGSYDFTGAGSGNYCFTGIAYDNTNIDMVSDALLGPGNHTLQDLISFAIGSGLTTLTQIQGAIPNLEALTGIALCYDFSGQAWCVSVASCTGGPNNPPIALPDLINVYYLGAGATINVLTNDSDPDGDVLIMTGIDSPDVSKGTISFNANGSTTFTPAAGFVVGDVIVLNYTISDGKGGTAASTLTIIASDCEAAAGDLQIQPIYCHPDDGAIAAILKPKAVGFNGSAGFTQIFVITDTDGNIISVSNNKKELPTPQDGEYIMYAINIADANPPTINIGDNIADIAAQQDLACFDISEGATFTILKKIQMSYTWFCKPGVSGSHFFILTITGGFPEHANFGGYMTSFPGYFKWDSNTQQAVDTLEFSPGMAIPFKDGKNTVLDITDDWKCTAGTFLLEGGPCEIPCDPTPGDMPPALELCNGATASVQAIGSQLDAGEVQCYILHSGSGSLIDGIIAQNTTGVFTQADGPIAFGVTYYISSVVGPADNSGCPDLTNPCTGVAPGTPVTWYNDVVPAVDYICLDDNSGALNLFIAATGGKENNYTVEVTIAGVTTVETIEGGKVVELDTLMLPEVPDGDPADTITTFGGNISWVVTDAIGCSASGVMEVSCIVTPITLLSFDGLVQENGNLLRWATATEINNDYFTLFRSADGVKFTKIAKVEGNGTTSSAHEYSFLDKNAPAGISYYKLVQTDFNGQSNPAGLISLMRQAGSLQVVSVSPSPTTDFVNITFNQPTNSITELVVTDVAGKLMTKKLIEGVSGKNVYKLDATNYAAGIYFVNIVNGNDATSTRFMKKD
jgi:hypothetical protein